MKSPFKKILALILILILLLIITRLSTPREIDDLNPLIPCEQNYIDKSDILWVIPIYKEIPISKDKAWCQEILSLNKTLGMHGIYHTYHEFDSLINETELQKAMNEFQNCFNQTPKIFKAPNLVLSKENKILLKEYNLEIRNPFDQTIHKVYHCNDSGILPNWLHDLI